MSISQLFEIGRRSLLGYKSAIDTTSGNIANANREGYTRRRVNLDNLTSDIGLGYGRIGAGVNADQLSRMRHKFAEYSLWRENASYNNYAKQETLLSQIESILGDDSEAGLQNIMSEFWNAWNDLANDPESESARVLVKNKGLLLANTFNRTHERVVRFQRQMEPEIRDTVSMVNQISAQLLQLNEQFRLNPGAPDLMDQRDSLITQMSDLINVEVKEKDNGEISLFFNGHILVSENKINQLETSIDRSDNLHRIAITFKDSNYRPEITAGSLAGLVEVFNNKVPEYMNNLDALAREVVRNVNSVHRNGSNVAGTTGVNFFEQGAGGASDFRVSNAVVNDPTLIASRSNTEAVGGNSTAEAIFNLQFNSFVSNQTPGDFYTSLTTSLGTEISDVSFLAHSQELIAQQLKNQRDEVSGVSLDEEMTKLVQYEQAYEAAAKIIQTVDEMLETVINLR